MKDFINLLDVQVACTIKSTLNLAKAAKRLSMPRATLVASLLRLERRLDNRIFERRQGSGVVTPTFYGETIIPMLEQLLWMHKNIIKHNDFSSNKNGMKEAVVTSTQTLLEGFILPYLKNFLTQHEGVRVGLHQIDDILISNQGINHIHLGLWLDDIKNYSYFPFHNFRQKLWASPAYLEKAGTPLKVEDLLSHHILAQKSVNEHDMAVGNDLISRILAQHAETIHIVDVSGPRVVDRMAELGLGIMIASEETVKLSDLNLQRVLPDFMGDSVEIFVRVNKNFLNTPLAQFIVDWIFECRDLALENIGMPPSIPYKPFNPKP